jgi:thymidylate synthase
MKDFSKEQQIGLLIIQLNQHLANRLKNETEYRYACLKFSETSKNNKGDFDNALGAMTTTKKWIEEDDKQIKIIRELIEEIKKGSFKI